MYRWQLNCFILIFYTWEDPNDFYAVIYDRPAKKPRLRLTCPWLDQTSATAAPSGTITKETRNTKMIWCSVGMICDRQIQENSKWVWSGNTTITNNTSSVTDMLDYLGWETHEPRTKLQLTDFYKILHDLIAIPHSRYWTPASKKTRAAHSYKFQQYPTSTNSFKFSFFSRTIPVWNKLPASAA